jgi:hypothetical protein
MGALKLSVQYRNQPMTDINEIIFKSLDGVLYISFQGLVLCGVSDDTVKHGCMTNRGKQTASWVNIKDDSDARKTWVKFESIPTATKGKIEAQLGEVYNLAMVQILRGRVSEFINKNDVSYYINNTVKTGDASYTLKEANDMSEACGWLRMCGVAVREKWWKNEPLQISNNEFIDNKIPYLQFVAEVIKNRNLYGFKVGNGRHLELKLQDFQERGRDCLVSRYFGNSNSTRLTQTHIDFNDFGRACPFTGINWRCGIVIFKTFANAINFHLSASAVRLAFLASVCFAQKKALCCDEGV